MGVEIQPYAERMVSSVQAFNRRLCEAGVTRQFPESHVSRSLPKGDGVTVYQEYFLAVDGDQVCGGYVLKHQTFCFDGKTVPGAFCRAPLSEGIVDRRYELVGAQLVRDATRNRSVLLSTGMGGMDQPYAQLLRSLGWGLYPVPFRFRVVDPFRFLRGIESMRSSVLRRLALDAAAFSGLGALGVKLFQTRGNRPAPAADATRWKLVPKLDAWTDDLWHDCRDAYAMTAVRDADLLAALYPEQSPRFLRLKVSEGDRDIGWAVVLDTEMDGHAEFGDLRVGSIADTLARPEHAHQVTEAATQFLETRGVDLIVTNQCHDAWCSALDACGYLRGRSNFILAASPDVQSLLEPFEANIGRVHINRGDGDGPIRL